VSHDHDFTPLGDRLGALEAGRIAAALAVLVIPALVGDASADLLPLAVAFVALTGMLELVRWRRRARALPLVMAMLLLDAAFLAVATTLTGGPGSPLLFLMLLDVLAVTLLVSYRTGVKIAVWCALLLFLGQAAIRAGAITAARPAGDREVALGAAAFLVVALVAAGFSALNERTLRASRRQLAALVELDAELARANGPRDVARALAAYARDDLGFQRAAVLLPDDGSWIMVVAPPDRRTVEIGPCPPPTAADLRPEPDPAAVDGGHEALPAWRLRKTLEAGGTLDTALPGAHGVAVAPIETDGAPAGLIAAEWGDRARIPAIVVQCLAQAAGHAGLSLSRLTLLSEVEALATVDPLTRIANRRVFDDALDRELQRAERTGDPVTVVVVDADRFKQINDKHGHRAGDEVLQVIGRALAEDARGLDVVARVGGDEFALVLPACSAEEAPVVAQRMCDAVTRAVTRTRFTVSAGWATAPDHGLDPAGLLELADRALYRAKRAGRARVGSPEEPGDERALPSAG
jgi:two-component system, cell cycle response regulator